MGLYSLKRLFITRKFLCGKWGCPFSIHCNSFKIQTNDFVTSRVQGFQREKLLKGSQPSEGSNLHLYD